MAQDALAIDKMFRQAGGTLKKENAKKAAKDAGASDQVAQFFDGLSQAEIDTVNKAWKKMDELGVKAKADGATVTFF
jgi:hypothetical protein